MIGKTEDAVRRSILTYLLGASCAVVLVGCGSTTSTGTPASKGEVAGQAVPAGLTSDPADAALDLADGDTQEGEFEGDHQFGAADASEDGAENDRSADPDDGDTQDGEFEGDHQFGADDGLDDGTDDSEGAAGGTELRTVFSSAGFEATLEYSVTPERTALDVVVAGGEPDEVVEISANDLVVLTITLDANGAASVEFSSAPDEPEQLQLPAGFPALSLGDVVGIRGLSADLADDAGADNGPNDEIEDGTDDGESDH